jgi:peptidoglycan/xylan/chitin deacetylase (PgdA/CDA1 family)
MYHDVTPTTPVAGGGSDFFSVSQATFAHQLSLIDALGLRGCSIADLLDDGAAGRVAVSFDDGDLGQADRAFPALAARGMTATFFITTSWIGRPRYASWNQLREMAAAGMSIQSHTHTHPFLSELSEPALRDELRRSRDMLDEQLSQRTSMIALPGGDAPRRELRGVLHDEGFRVVATSRWGINRDAAPAAPVYVRRCTVRGDSSDAHFRDVVRGSAMLRVKKRTRESVLAFIRSSLGPTRYARWRRGFLDAANSSGARRA